MSSSWEQQSSSSPSEESFQDAQTNDGLLATGSTQPEVLHILSQLPDGGSQSLVTLPANATFLSKEERRDKLRKIGEETKVPLSYDEYVRLQFGSPVLKSSLWDDKPSQGAWRQRTMAWRDIAASLDHARSVDLSIHLYNTFKFRQRAKSKVADASGYVETETPPRGWAAWPLVPDSVPRMHQQSVWGDDDWRVGPYLPRQRRPGDELRELLMARAMKTGKERLLARGAGVFRDDNEDQEYQKPAVMIDDQSAENLLRSSIQHALGSLDRLLTALHHTRSSYMAPEKPVRRLKRRRRRKLVANEDNESVENQELPLHSDELSGDSSISESEFGQSKDSKYRAKRKGKATDEPVKSRPTFRRGKANTVGLRDWTDIVGTASMIGISSPVNTRTTSRCTNVFGGNQNPGAGGLGSTNVHVLHVGVSGEPDNHGDKGSTDEELQDGIHVDGFLQPIERYTSKTHTKTKSKAPKSGDIQDTGTKEPSLGFEEESASEPGRGPADKSKKEPIHVSGSKSRTASDDGTMNESDVDSRDEAKSGSGHGLGQDSEQESEAESEDDSEDETGDDSDD